MTDYFNKIGKPLYDTFVKTRWFNGVPFGGDQNNKEEYMERTIDLDRYNEKRSQILSELSISKLWDIINQEDCFTEEEVKEVLTDFIYNHEVNLDTLEEYQ